MKSPFFLLEPELIRQQKPPSLKTKSSTNEGIYEQSKQQVGEIEDHSERKDFLSQIGLRNEHQS
jgi:hypothetical protein